MGETTGVVLAGGKSSRMGEDKRFLDAGGVPLIGRVVSLAAARCEEVLVSANDPGRFEGILPRGVRLVPDLDPGGGPLAGIHAGLRAARNEWTLVLPCDAPFVAPALLDRLRVEAERGRWDVVCGSTEAGVEPLVAYYRKVCVGAIESEMAAGRRKVTDFFPRVRALVLDPEEVARVDPTGRSFVNLNTPSDYAALASARSPARRSEAATR